VAIVDSALKRDQVMAAGGPVREPIWRERLRRAIEGQRTQNWLVLLIVINAAVLGLETSAAISARWGDLLVVTDRLILAIFVVEIGVRLVVHRLAFFRDPWSVFDFIVVGIALLPASGPLAVLRAIRVLRVMRLISVVPSMRRVASGLLAAIPGLGAVIGIIVVILYVSSVISTKLFGEHFPQWFGTLGESAFTLFQIMTLESWAMGIVRPVMEVYPYAWIFFVLFILVSTFTMLNLFIAVVVNAMHAEHQREVGEERAEDSDHTSLRSEISELRAELRCVHALLLNRPAMRRHEDG
jgi:voltage-gated sodium channel